MFKLAKPLINVFLAFFLLFQIIYFNINYWITADAPVYLSYARDISEGHILYKNITEISDGTKLYTNTFIYINNEHLIMVYPRMLFDNLFYKNKE